MAQDYSIGHFSHPGHELVKRHYGWSFGCNLCGKDLSGPGYGCRAGCDFDIHESCAGHPQTLSSPAHHAHQLVLVQTRHDMHPRCERLPQAAVRSSRHPGHDLALVVADGRCASAACRLGGDGRRGWFYRCVVCNVDLHVSCASGGGAGNDAGARHDGNVPSHDGSRHAPSHYGKTHAPRHDWNGHAPRHDANTHAPRHDANTHAPRHDWNGHAPRHNENTHAPRHEWNGYAPRHEYN